VVLKKIIKSLVRKRQPVVFNDLLRTKPISDLFGRDRGTAIDRYYIQDFLRDNSSSITGRVLEIGDSHYSRLYGGGRVTVYEVLHATAENSKATIIGDLTQLDSLPENHVDCFICTQTFNFIFDVGKAVVGAHKLLKPGGTLLATVAGISQISRYDMERWGDYWRFTTASVRMLFEPVFAGGLEVGSFGNVAAATAFLQGVALEDLPDPSVLDVHDPDYQLIITIVARKKEEQ
jgi:hypothetical protein